MRSPRIAHGQCLLLALLLSAGNALAQGTLLEPAPSMSATTRPMIGATAIAPPVLIALSGPVDPTEYTVGPGDLLQINLAGGIARSWEILVSPEGTLLIPNVGSIAVTGGTLLDTRRAVQQRVLKSYSGVSVDLRLLRPRTLLVYLAGSTSKAGPIEVSAANRASEILTEPLFAADASRRNVEIRRRTPQGEAHILVDIARYRLTGRLARDPLLREGDVIFLPVAKAHIGIDGAVGRAERYELAPGDSLSTLFALAGGALAEAADQAILVRFRDATSTDSISFRVSDIVAGQYDLALQDGDRVFVYYQPGYHALDGASILGEVQRPGTYPLDPGRTRLSELVRSAGGFLPAADLAALRVYRASARAATADAELDRLAQLSRNEMTSSEFEVMRARMTARREDFRVDWNSLMQHPDLDLTIRSGDIVRVERIATSIRVEGEVRRPGLVRFVAGRSAKDYVSLTGGFSKRASRSQVRITRAVTGQTLLARDVDVLEPGDMIWVPERPESTAFRDIQTLLLLAAQIATVIVAVRR